MSVKLSSTGRGLSWLENFPDESRAIATQLLDAFMLVSWSDARIELRRRLEFVYNSAVSQRKGPAWVLPVMADEDTRAMADLDRGIDPVAFENFLPASGISSTPGSEGAVGNLVRDSVLRGAIGPKTDVEELRSKKVRTVILVTDLVESGSQVEDFAASLLRNTTLRSWKSGRWIQIWVVAYAVSQAAQEKLESSPFIDKLFFVTSAPAIESLPWPRSSITQAQLVCMEHARRKVGAMGYKGHGGLFAFQERPPNTSPAVFRQTGKDWSPLFEGRRTPDDLQQELRNVSKPETNHALTLTAVYQQRLSANIERQFRADNQVILTALALLLRDPTAPGKIASALSLSQTAAEAVIAFLHRMGWVTDDGFVTEAGRAELRAGKRAIRRVGRKNYPEPDAPYYPSSLR